MIDNGNRTEWSPHTSDEQEWITVKQESDLSITSMIMERIRQHKVLLPINHSCYNFQKQQIHFKLAEPKQISTPKICSSQENWNKSCKATFEVQ